MITIESGVMRVNRGVEEAPITYWPAGQLWDIPDLLSADQPLLGAVVLPQPTRIPVEERARRIEEEIRERFTEQARKTSAQQASLFQEKYAEKRAEEAQWETGYRAAQATQAHEQKMAEMAVMLQEKEAQAREREALLATQQQLSILRQAQRTMQSEESLIEAQRQREAMEAMRKSRPETPAIPITPGRVPDFRPLQPGAPQAIPAIPATIQMQKQAHVELSPRAVPPVQRITGGGAPVPIRASLPAQTAPRATQEAAYQTQMSRMYPSAGDMQAAREMQLRAAQLSDLGRVTRFRAGYQYQPRRQVVTYRRQAQTARRSPAGQRPAQPSVRARTPVFQPMTRQPQRRAIPARPRTGLTAGRRRAVARRSPIPRVTQDIMAAMRRYR